MSAHPSPTLLPAPVVTVSLALPMTPDELAAAVKSAIAEAAAGAVRETIADETVISLEEAVAMTPWSVSGFKRVAGRQNLPFVKGPKKSKPGYRRGAVVAMLRKMQIWPHGRPAEAAAA